MRDFLSREVRALIENYEEVLSELRLEYLKKLNGNFLDKRPATFQKQCLAGLRESAEKLRPSREADTSIVGLSSPGKPRVREACTHRFPELIDRYDCCVIAVPSDFFRALCHIAPVLFRRPRTALAEIS